MHFALARAATTTRRGIVGIATGTVSAFGIAACCTSRFVSVPFTARLTLGASPAHISFVEIAHIKIA